MQQFHLSLDVCLYIALGLRKKHNKLECVGGVVSRKKYVSASQLCFDFPDLST